MMKTKLWLLTFIFLSICINDLHAESYTVKVGEEQYLPVPSVSKGYVDKAIWACSSPSIQFVSKDEVGATIKVVSAISGTAIVELVYVAKYVDDKGWTRSYTLQHNYYISSTSVEGTVLSIPQEIEVYVNSEITLQPAILPNGAQIKELSCNVSPTGYAGAVPMSNMTVVVRGIKSGKCTLTITSGSLSASCNVTVIDVPGTESHAPMISTLTKEKTMSRLKDIIQKTNEE